MEIDIENEERKKVLREIKRLEEKRILCRQVSDDSEISLTGIVGVIQELKRTGGNLSEELDKLKGKVSSCLVDISEAQTKLQKDNTKLWEMALLIQSSR